MDFPKRLGIYSDKAAQEATYEALRSFIRIKLKSIGLPTLDSNKTGHEGLLEIAEPIIEHYQEQFRMLKGTLSPVDQRIKTFLDDYFSDYIQDDEITFPETTLVLDRHGVARTLSLPAHGDKFQSDIVNSYRIKQGVLHNPQKDRRTTKGVFHIAEGGLPIPNDKKAVPKVTAARLLKAAFRPPEDLLLLPYHFGSENPARTWVSLLLRPLVCPEVPGFIHEKTMEVRFYAPGNLVSNLDFVESIFGNAGDPFLSENDAGLDVMHWTGHTGCVILAPHLLQLTKKELGLPHISEATERQKRDAMCWENEDEKYNDGSAFKITCRDERGVIVTAIADNYFGYCKKEVKTQISYAANLYGLCEEEHAGGTMVYPAYDLGEVFQLSNYSSEVDHTFEQMVDMFGDIMEVQPEGFALDKSHPNIIYLPETAIIRLVGQTASWEKDGEKQELHIEPGKTYVLPSGYKVQMVKPHEDRRWRLIGVSAQASFCHKPCTVSGGGKSEISKSLNDAIIVGPHYMENFKEDFDLLETILYRDYRFRFKDPELRKKDSRPILSPKRSLGSVIKLMTPSASEYTEEYNAWLESIPEHVRNTVFTIKRFYKEDWESNWRTRFSVDTINGQAGKELRYQNNKILTHYLRVGYLPDGSWRIFQLRKDFYPAAKLSMEDDITASVTTPLATIPYLKDKFKYHSLKYAQNCEYRFFQRPDDAIIRGYDKQAEGDISSPGAFLSNYEPLNRDEAIDQVQDVIRFDKYTDQMKEFIQEMADGEGPDYFCSTANPRIVNGKPTKNPRYLQVRPDIVDEPSRYLAWVGSHFFYRIPPEQVAPFPITAILPGRRNNPPDPTTTPPTRALCVYNPIHYMDLPELFMEFIASLTGKSPSTTGAGSEGALTKAPFNALLPIHDLNSALVAYVMVGAPAFLSSAGHVGPKYRVDHDVSLLIPEIWSRMHIEEQNAEFLIENGYLEKCEDFEHNGKTVMASRLGYRINNNFMRIFGGRVFTNPSTVFPEEMMKPELQDIDIFVDGIDNITSAHKWVAENYFADNSIELACPPLKAILHIMVHGEYKGKTIDDPEVRNLFKREVVLQSDWYQQRLKNRQEGETRIWKKQIENLKQFMAKSHYHEVAEELNCAERLVQAEHTLEHVQTSERLKELEGTIGTDTFYFENSR